MLSNAQWEKFACSVAEGMAIGAAYEAAGYATTGNASEVNGCRLLKRPEVAERIRELQALAVERTGETIEKITGELNDAFKMAKEEGRPDRMVAASMAKAKLNGLIVEKSESTVTHRHEDRVAQREAAIARRRRELQERADGADGDVVH